MAGLGRLVELESVFSKLVTSTRNRAPRRSQIEEVQKLSLENWSFHRIQTLSEREGELAEALGRARRRLDRARDVLDQAEDMLTDARRNVKWWACLYQLRAQLHVELFLLQVTEIWPSEEWKGEKRRFIARTVNQLESGLRAIRQGLDVVLPPKRVREHGGKLRKNLRIVRPVRL